MNVAESIPYLQKIVGKTTGNAKFTDLAADALKLDTAVTALATANTGYEKSKKDTKEALIVRDNAFVAAGADAHALASGAMKITTDAADLTSGGWDLASDGSPVGQMTTPANFHATTGDMTGSVDLAWDTQRGVQTHKWINRLDATPARKVWQNYRETRLTYEKSYLARLNYVHQNPVKHGLVPMANQYPWCSARWFERTGTPAQIKTIFRFKTDQMNVPDNFEVSPDW